MRQLVVMQEMASMLMETPKSLAPQVPTAESSATGTTASTEESKAAVEKGVSDTSKKIIEDAEDSDARPGHMYRVVQRYVTGEYFGEEGILNLPPRRVEFVAKQRATIIEFERSDFQWLLEGQKLWSGCCI